MVTLRRPPKPIRRMKAWTRHGSTLVSVYAERSGLAITQSVGPAIGYSITHVPTGCRIGPLYGLTWRGAATALALMADAFPWETLRSQLTSGCACCAQLWEFVVTVEDMIDSGGV